MINTIFEDSLEAKIATLLKDPDIKQLNILLNLGDVRGTEAEIALYKPVSGKISYAKFSTFFRAQMHDDGTDETNLIEDPRDYPVFTTIGLDGFNYQLNLLRTLDSTLRFSRPKKVSNGLYLISVTRGYKAPDAYSVDKRYFKVANHPYPGTFQTDDSTRVNDIKVFIDAILTDMNVYKATLYQDSRSNFSIQVHSNTSYRNDSTIMVVEGDRKKITEALSLIEEDKVALEEKLGLKIDISMDSFYIRFNVEKNLRFNPRYLIKSQRLSKPMWDFLADAYKAGINIVVTGATGYGKSSFLRYLYDGTSSNNETLVSDKNGELPISENRNLTSIMGDDATVISMAKKIKPERLVLDESPLVTEAMMSELNDLNSDGVAILAAMHGSARNLRKSFPSDPFEIEVGLSSLGEVSSIEQLAIGNSSVNSITQRTLWNSNFYNVREPNRTLRRKIENGLKAHNENGKKSDGNAVNIVTMSSEEKEKLREAMDIIKKYLGE